MTKQYQVNSLRDKITNAPLSASANATMAVADAIQRFSDKGARFMGLACAFLLSLEKVDIPFQDAMEFANNCMNDAKGKRPEFEAVKTYIENEIFN